MKIVGPTISRYWEDKIESANTLKELNALRNELQDYRVLDPACGSGNFLYIAYQELKRVESVLIAKISENFKSVGEQMQIGFVTPLQFFGIDNNAFAVELARVTMMIARKVAIDKLGLSEPSLPLDTLDQNIVCQDALFYEWEKVDAVIGNPPFLGGSRIRTELGDNYAEKVFQRFSDIRAQVDFSSYWFRLAHDHIEKDGRAGLVATNSISQGKSRSVSLDYITKNKGIIHEAISTQPWSGQAKVHVSIVNWSKQNTKVYHLNNQIVSKINSSLKASVDVSEAKKLKTNLNKSFVGMQPNGKGFYIAEDIAKKWIKAFSENQDILNPA